MNKKRTIVIENRNEFVSEYLNAYMAMKDIDFAVMISGPWGCGKTHFIKDYLNRCRQLLPDPGQNLFWYVSVHGVSNCAEIDLRLYEAAHPVIGNGTVKLVGHLVRGIAETGLKIGCQVDTKSVGKIFDASKKLYDKLITLYDGKKKPSLIVFDDFERSRLDKTVLLGYISDLLQAQVPIVIIGAENEIETSLNDEGGNKNIDQYRRIREKVIGQTFYLQDELRDLFRTLIGDDVYPNAQDWLKCQYVDIVADLRKGQDDKWQCNYRALKHAFRQLDYILGGMKKHKNIWANKAFMISFSRVFVVIGYQVQIGGLTEKDFEVDSCWYEDIKDNKLVVFLREREYSLSYNNLGQPTLLLPVKELKNIFFGYNSDRNRIGKMIASLPIFSKLEPDDWYLLWRWFQLEDNEAEEIYERIIKGISEYKYVKAGEIVHIFSTLCVLSNRKYIKKSVSSLKREFKEYIAKLDGNGKLYIDEQWQFQADDGWGGCGYWHIEKCDKQPCREFYDVISDMLKQKEIRREKGKKEQLFYSFSDNPEELRKELMMGAPDGRPILQDIKAVSFFEEFQKANNDGRVKLRYAFNYRFKQYFNPATFMYEKDFVNDLLGLIRKWLRANKKEKFGKTSYMVVDEIREILEETIVAHEKLTIARGTAQ